MTARLVILTAITGLSQACLGQVFTGLGFIPGDSSSKATALSADGTTVVGDGFVGQGIDAWRWRAGSPLQLIAAQSGATSISADGSALAGLQVVTPFNHPAFRWSESSGVQVIAGMQAGGAPSPGISGDGLVVVGADGRWAQQTGVVHPPIPGPGPYAQASAGDSFATNADGSVVVGVGSVAFLGGQSQLAAYRWSLSSGTQILLANDGSIPDAGATGVSFDGSTVIIATSLIYRWRAATNAVPVPGLAVDFTSPPAISGDGNTIVSINNVWNATTGTQPLTTLLTSAGCNFSGWSGLIVTGVDGDGRAFCGYGTDPTGTTEAWYATVPAPSSLPLLIGAGLAVSHRRRSKR